ncbi:hypothetical protein AAFF_G00313750 [Aldrovandia affinis]|uniref:RGS domain-containing protein n=1 Tax=Aldrovandia affinis TaxID=143900 RepID=A0AAD7R7H6_9TELE|nr:hypothetical protein AAFF_G00313750 [Aldrovandia affinis]
MRRFSSEGSLLDLDFLPWKRVDLREQDYGQDGTCGTYTPHLEVDELHGQLTGPSANDGEPSGGPRKARLSKEFSVSAENVSGLGQGERGMAYLCVAGLGEGFRAYSDSQLTPGGAGSSESLGHTQSSSSSSSSSSAACFSSRALHRQQARARLTSAKLHLKNLFGQSPHSSNSNLSAEQKHTESREKKSRLPFLRQWSQVGHSSGRLSREELQSWAESLDTLLASRAGVSVFGAFLRSEFSEENLQFYLACEQYRQTSTFSLQRRARDISSTYIEPGAPREVNLDSKTRELTVQLLQAPSHSSLSHAQRRILHLLDADCYPRFLQSPLYLSLLKSHDSM